MSNPLRQFDETHIEEDLSKLHSVQLENALLYGCTLDDLRGLTLKDCVLDRSKFTTNSVAKAQGFTLTLNCHSFNDVEYSPLLVDLMLYLLTTTKGNDERRDQVRGLLGKEKVAAFDRLLKGVE